MLITEYLDPYANVYWAMLRQVGVEGAISKLDRRFDGEWNNSGDAPWDLPVLDAMKRRFERHGLELLGIEDYPPMDRLRLGLPGREEELEWTLTLIRNMGKLGIPMLCYNWMGVINWVRTEIDRPGRGGALVTAFRHADMVDTLTWAGSVAAEQLWAAWEWFMDRAVPVAEAAGVRLALHPDDPPIASVRGVARIMNSLESYDRAMAYLESEANAVCLCQGNFALFCDDIAGAIRRYGSTGRIAFGHFRDVSGTASDFVETFHDEGKTDKVAAMEAWHEIGFAGPIRPDHVPTLEGESNDDPAYAWLGRLHAVGYLQGLRAAARERRSGV
ncbi:MAG: mannonate dehydratase [Gaiellales bacterium]